MNIIVKLMETFRQATAIEINNYLFLPHLGCIVGLLYK